MLLDVVVISWLRFVDKPQVGANGCEAHHGYPHHHGLLAQVSVVKAVGGGDRQRRLQGQVQGRSGGRMVCPVDEG